MQASEQGLFLGAPAPRCKLVSDAGSRKRAGLALLAILVCVLGSQHPEALESLRMAATYAYMAAATLILTVGLLAAAASFVGLLLHVVVQRHLLRSRR